ncbi:MAG: hypothetical protein R6V12_19705 [Candidatus Hydrogenedentota bacterium]
MKMNDALFLVCVCAVAVVFVFATLTPSESATPSASAPSELGGAGRPRDIDTERIRTMIERGELSDHEAEFYREAPSGPQKEGLSTPE